MEDYSKENLNVTHYRNGDPIPFVKSKKKWRNLTTGAYCYYDNDPEKGVLYNWYAVNDSRGLAPEGWKIPTIEELEQIDLTTGLPNGYRGDYEDYYSISYYGNWWSSTEYITTNAWSRTLSYSYDDAYRYNPSKEYGLSVRCLKDEVIINKSENMEVVIDGIVMDKTEFFAQHGGNLVIAQEDSPEYGDFLFLHPEEIDKVKQFDTIGHQVVSVHETEGEDFIDMGKVDYGNQPYKYGYYVIKKK